MSLPEPDSATGQDLDLVLWGATGFVGRLMARQLARRGSLLRWGLAARDAGALRALHTEIGAPADVPLIVADAEDAASLEAMTARTRLVLSTVGPYQRYGTLLARICATSGTAYVDINGEPLWARRIINSLEDEARNSGACMVLSCGFDSLPFELVVHRLQSAAVGKWGRPLAHVSSRITFYEVGGFSAGTLNSLLGTADEARADPAAATLSEDPYLLAGGFRGPRYTAPAGPHYDDVLRMWAVPWVMSPVNTANLHRSNHLRNRPWGEDFTYDEMLLAGPGDTGRQTADAIARAMAALVAPRDDGPAAQEDLGIGVGDPRYTVTAYGQDADGERLFTTVAGEGSPGYDAAAAMALEVAHCVLEDLADTSAAGIWTPGALATDLLMDRFERSGLMRFDTPATAA